MSIRNIIRILGVALLALLVGCGREDPAQKRREAVLNNTQEIVIGLCARGNAWRKDFADGVLLRVDELNGQRGLLGRRIKIVQPKEAVRESTALGQALVDVPDMTAAIVRLGLEKEMPIAVMTQYHGMVMLSGSRNGTSLMELNFSQVFHGLPDIKSFAGKLATFSRGKNFNTVVVVYGLGELERNMADMFELAARDAGVRIPERIPLSDVGGSRIYEFGRSKNKGIGADALFVAVNPDKELEAISALRNAGVDLPLMVMPLLLGKDFLLKQGGKIGTLYTLSSYVSTREGGVAGNFLQEYFKKYKTVPIVTAAEGYDAMSLLAEAVEKAGSPAPEAVARKLRSLSGLVGVNGTLGFNGGRNLVAKKWYVLKNEGNIWKVDKGE